MVYLINESLTSQEILRHCDQIADLYKRLSDVSEVISNIIENGGGTDSEEIKNINNAIKQLQTDISNLKTLDKLYPYEISIDKNTLNIKPDVQAGNSYVISNTANKFLFNNTSGNSVSMQVSNSATNKNTSLVFNEANGNNMTINLSGSNSNNQNNVILPNNVQFNNAGTIESLEISNIAKKTDLEPILFKIQNIIYPVQTGITYA